MNAGNHPQIAPTIREPGSEVSRIGGPPMRSIRFPRGVIALALVAAACSSGDAMTPASTEDATFGPLTDDASTNASTISTTASEGPGPGTDASTDAATDDGDSSVSDDSGSSSTGPELPSECDDGIDNDGDGYADWHRDLGCYGPGDHTEAALPRDEEDGFTTFEIPEGSLASAVAPACSSRAATSSTRRSSSAASTASSTKASRSAAT